jgi:hypothetical protein
LDNRRGKADIAGNETGGQKSGAANDRPETFYALAGTDNRHAGKNQDRNKTEAIDADIGSHLRHGAAGPPCRTRRIPRKAGQYSAAQNFEQAEQAREQKETMRLARPETVIQEREHTPEQANAGWQEGRGERRHPAIGLGIDQEGFRHPETADEKVAEPRQPTGKENTPARPRAKILLKSKQKKCIA